MNKKTALVVIAALMITACSRMESPVQEGTPVALRYTSFDIMGTKAAQDLNEGTFAEGETVKVRISNTGAGSWTDYDFTTAAAGAMTAPDPGPYYPTGSQNIDIVAYYPASAGTLFSVQADQTSDDAYKASDLMFASVTNQAKQTGAVNLAFAHRMAKINVNITAGEGVTSITGVSLLNVKPTVSFDPATGAVGAAGGSATAIAMSNNGSAVIPAQTISGGLLSIVTDKGTATYTVTGKEFAAGQQYTINITVNLRAVGATTAITGWTSEGTLTVNPVITLITVPVDLGLPSGLKWATCNVGASSPEEYGDYFAWGETEPKTNYNWSTYKWCKGTHDTQNKYNIWFSYGVVDLNTVLDPEDDAAHVNWGGTWRMPTDKDWTELRNNCNWTWTTQKGVNGSLFTGPNGNSIFLPAAGCRSGTSFLTPGSFGFYWSSSLVTDYPDGAWDVFFNSGDVLRGYDNRCDGYTVRPVTD